MDRIVLQQYCYLKGEAADLAEKINSMQVKLGEITESGYTVKDSVVCGKKGKKPLGSKKVEGRPEPEIRKRRTVLFQRQLKYASIKSEIDNIIKEVDEYIAGIQDSEVRQIVRLKCNEDRSWINVAEIMNRRYPKRKRAYTEESCRKKFERELEKK